MSLLLLLIRLTLRYLPSLLLYFTVFNFVIRRSFLHKKEKRTNIYRKSQKIWEIVVLTDRCAIKKMISKKKCNVNAPLAPS